MREARLLWFRNNETSSMFQAYSMNGLTWFVRTGNQVPCPDGMGYEDEEILYPWELFIKHFEPMDDEARDEIRKYLTVIQMGYAQKLETIDKYLKFDR